MSVRDSPARTGQNRSWLFLRTLVGTLLVGWLIVAIYSPPDPFVFSLTLVPVWLTGGLVAWWLIYRDGFAVLSDSSLYNPSTEHSRAVAVFVLIALCFKLLATGVLTLTAVNGYLIDTAISCAALMCAYLVAFH